MVAQELPFHPEVRPLIEEQVVTHLVPRMARVVTRFQERGEVVVDPASVVRVLNSAAFSYLALRFVITPHREWDGEAETELNVKLVVGGLRPRRQ